MTTLDDAEAWLKGLESGDDLVVKPFHQAGKVTSLREFSTNAMNHHHGMQSAERFGSGVDADMDGIADELTRAEGVRRRSRAQLLAPQRGSRRKLLDLARENAAHAFAEKRRRDEDMDARLAEVQRKLRLPTKRSASTPPPVSAISSGGRSVAEP